MLFYGNSQNIQTQCIVYNFSSFIEGFEPVGLIPPNTMGHTSDDDFDAKYFDYIYNDDMRFMRMFQIVLGVVSGIDIYLTISEDQWSEALIESFLKIIETRYGLTATRVNCEEDVFTANLPQLDVAKGGLYNYDQDVDRYTYISNKFKEMGGVS